MPEEQKDQNATITLESFWKLLDSKLISLGIPGALIAVALDFVRKNEWQKAGLCVGAAGVFWVIIKVGNKLSPYIDRFLDWIFSNLERLTLDLWAKLTSDFEGKYYERLKFDCREYEIRGINRGALQLENVFVPLKMEQKIAEKIPQNIIQHQQASINPLEQQEIGNLLGFLRT